MYEVKVLLGSVCKQTGQEIWTLQLRYWRSIHAELMTHRDFSRNAGSSRAIPVKKVLSQVWNEPAGPDHWGSNQAGMQAGEDLTGWRLWAAKKVWKWTGRAVCVGSWLMMKLGLHKQVANRPLEPWQYINVVLTSTQWANFFELRCHPDAQPEFQDLARAIRFEMDRYRGNGLLTELQAGEWHLPYISNDERASLDFDDLLKLSTARCARVSYAPFDGNASLAKEIERWRLLVGSRPIHASPTEHQAMCMGDGLRYKNFTGWMPYRSVVEIMLEDGELK